MLRGRDTRYRWSKWNPFVFSGHTYGMEYRQLYDTDRSDAESKHLRPLVPAATAGGRWPKHSRREILNGIF